MAKKMWELLEYILNYLTEHGGFWGLLLGISVIWIAYRELNLFKVKNLSSKDTETNSSAKTLLLEESIIIKERQENQIRAIEENSKTLGQIHQKLADIYSHIDAFSELNKDNAEKIDKLNEKLQEVNDERVEELKEILSSYNKTMNELSLTLQKIKFFLRAKLGDS